MTATLWIITPVYLDVASFLILRDRLHDVVAATPEWRDCDLRFVVAEDTAGRDPEVRALDELEDVTVIQPPFNLGHQRAIVYALRKLGGRIGDDDYVVTMDSDGEDTPEDVPRLLAPLHEQTLQPVVVALRTSRQETFARSSATQALTSPTPRRSSASIYLLSASRARAAPDTLVSLEWGWRNSSDTAWAC
jgi:glycosyltransferase involved in cell wall biosynthesis